MWATTYNYIHLGNARPIVVFDTVRRYFTYLGYDVTFVSNFTDVDDKIIKRANEEGKDPVKLAAYYIDAYFEDTKALGVMPTDVHPKVSEHIPQIIDFVQGLIDKGYAYALDNGDVYYSVRKFDDYGQLSGRDINDLLSGARVEWTKRKKTHSILPSGRVQSRVNLIGNPHGARDVRAGTLNALP